MKPQVTGTGSRLSRFGAIALALLPLADCRLAYGTGFFVNQQSVRGLGRVNAGVAAAAKDASTVFFNPAGLPQLIPPESAHDRNNEKGEDRNLLTFGVPLIRPSYQFANTGSLAASPGTLYAPVPYAGDNAQNPAPVFPVPHFYLAHRINERAYLGLGANSPFGLTTKYDTDWFGRYDATEASLKTINVSLVGAYAVSDRLFIGGGIDVQYAKSQLTSAVPDVLAPGGPSPMSDGRSKLTGDAWTPGFNLGVLIMPFGDQRTGIGLTYRSGFKHELSGEVETTGLRGPFAAFNGVSDVAADLKLPGFASAGIYHELELPNGKRLGLHGQVDWFGWSTFDEVRIKYQDGRPDQVRAQNYRDTWSASIGADYRISDDLVLRAGLRVDETPTVNSDRDTVVPDASRLWLGIGATYRVRQNLSIDLAFTHVWFETAKVDVTRDFPLGSSVGIRSDVDTYANTLAAGLSYAF